MLASYLLVFVGVTMMNVALPAAQAHLGMSETDRQWVVTIYSLAFGGLMLLGGRVADTIGMRRAVVVGTLAFAGAALAGGTGGQWGHAGGGACRPGCRRVGVAVGHVPPRCGPSTCLRRAGGGDGDRRATSFVVAGWLTDAH